MNTKHNNAKGKRILFANFPADGHFNPLTGLAVHLASIGYDVRWYSSKTYEDKIKKLGIPFYAFKKALEMDSAAIDAIFPERKNATSQTAKLKFDIINVFIKRGPEYYEDIKNIRNEFTFDLMIADCLFTGIPFIKNLMNIPVVSVGVVPITENSRDLAPVGLGMEPARGFTGKIKMALLRYIAHNIIFKQPNKVLHSVFDEYGIPHNKEGIFDSIVKNSTLLLQSGTPSFEYKRSDLSRNIRFIGALLPHRNVTGDKRWFDERLNQYKKIVLVTQGTVEKEVSKIIIPTLEAFKGTDTLVVCTTGGSQTALLKEKYPQQNIIIEDFIPFADVMPYTSVYVTNGGYGGVMLGIQNKVPMVVAGVHEGKNEICARIGYFKYGINLKTELPTAEKVIASVEKILADKTYRTNVEMLSREFAQYNSEKLCEQYIGGLLSAGARNIANVKAMIIN